MIRIDLQIPKEGAGLPTNGITLIEKELDKRIHRQWPEALIRVRWGTSLRTYPKRDLFQTMRPQAKCNMAS
ncbi:hypothetical protein ETN89_15745 [Photobacterium damselae subsp. damselae]|nr:hypothetical protein CAY62_18800 [Photobacterium damselae subsp. damselae]QAY36759.1 hypothetical protein ETN89_15745 [Photobacterium damselae subsp. damselae]